MKMLPFHSSFVVAATLGALAAVAACGGISDPTRSSERVATVSGALTGTGIPANTRVALVWKVGQTGTYAVSNDVAVNNGKFTMDLSAPPDGYFFVADGSYDGLSGGGSPVAVAPTEDSAPDAPSGSSSGSSGTSGGSSGTSSGSSGTSTSGGGQSFAFASNVAPRDTVSGQITQLLSAAVAGFVVYVDTNGNGKLDIEGPWAKATDEVIGGNKELFLAYFRDGGALDYEKLRDRSGILPHAGYNLAWDEGRWLPLDVVELKIANNMRLSSAVCSGSGYAETPSSVGSSSGGWGGWGPDGYPDPNDPNLHCSPDGRSWSYSFPCDEPPPQPVPEGLCVGWTFDDSPPRACGVGGGSGIGPNDPIPEGWPCTVDSSGEALDGGPAPDAGM